MVAMVVQHVGDAVLISLGGCWMHVEELVFSILLPAPVSGGTRVGRSFRISSQRPFRAGRPWVDQVFGHLVRYRSCSPPSARFGRDARGSIKNTAVINLKDSAAEFYARDTPGAVYDPDVRPTRPNTGRLWTMGQKTKIIGVKNPEDYAKVGAT